MDKRLGIVLFLLFGVLGPLYLAIQYDLFNQAKAISPFLGLVSVLGVGFLAIAFEMKIYHLVHKRTPPELFSRFVGLMAILCLLFPSVSF